MGVPALRFPGPLRTSIVVIGSFFGCYETSKPGGSSTPPAAPPDWLVAPMDDSACTDRPAARRFAHLTSFWTEEPITLDGRLIQRGLVLAGGMGNADALADLWVYDLSTPVGDPAGTYNTCPWHRISTDTPGLDPGFGGAFAFDQDEAAFLLVGGITSDGVTYAASSRILRLDLDALGDGFYAVGTLPDLEYTFANTGDPFCANRTLSHTYVEEVCEDGVCECDVVETCIFDTCTNAPIGDCESDPHDFGCTADPTCQSGYADGTVVVSAPGLWSAGSFYIQDTSQLWLVNGTTGCQGDCEPWEDLFAADSSHAESLNAANSEWALSVSTSGAVEVHAVPPEHLRESVIPALASIGVRGAAGAHLGEKWSVEERVWTLPTTHLHPRLIGGTLHQNLQPGHQYDVTCAELLEDAESCGDHCVHYVGTSTVTPGYTSEFDGQVHGADAVQWWSEDDVRFARYTVYPELSALIDPAVATIKPGASFIVAGGRHGAEPDGMSQVWVVENGAVREVPGGLDGVHYGASAAFEPLTQSSYIFGGSFSDTKMYQVVGPHTRKSGANAVLTPRTAEVSLMWLADDEWAVKEILNVDVTCSVQGCFSEELVLGLPVKEAAEIATLRVTVTSDTWSVTLGEPLVKAGATSGANEAYLVAYVLPVISEGDQLVVEVSYTRDVPAAQPTPRAALDQPGFFKLDVGTTPDVSTMYALSWAPAWILTEPSLFDGATHTMAFTTEVTAPPGYVVVAPGARTQVGDQASFSSFSTSASGYHVLLMEKMTEQGSFVEPVGQLSVSMLADPFVVAVNHGFLNYLNPAMAGNIMEDVDFLVEKLGPLTAYDTHHVVYLRGGTTAGEEREVGITQPGFSLVMPFEPDGSPIRPSLDKGTTVHELAHLWFGVMTRFEDSSYWVQEGIPELLKHIRWPGGSFMRESVDASIERGLRRLQVPRIPDETLRTFKVGYLLAPYFLSQLYHMTLIDGGSAGTFWQMWRDLLAANQGTDKVADADIAAALATLPHGEVFYDEWIDVAGQGVPLLGITDFAWVEGGEDSGDTGGASSSSGVVTVTQVQVELFGFAEFSYVPFYVGCVPEADQDVLAFEGCQTTMTDLVEARPLSTGPARGSGDLAVEVPLVPSTDLGSGVEAMPALVALVAADMLLPDQTPTASVQAYTWLLRCVSGSTDPVCLLDDDGDGYPVEGDCDDNNPLVFPGPCETVHDGVDYNCDGWKAD